MHAKCFDEIQQSMIIDIGSRHNSGSNHLKMLKSCFHHSLKNLHDHTQSACWKMKKFSDQKEIANYPDGCIICLNSFSFGCVSAVKKATQIVIIEGDTNDKKIIDCMVSVTSYCYSLI